MKKTRTQRAYDHRLVRLVQETGDTSIAPLLGVPRSTAAGWIRRATKSVTTRPDLDESPAILRARVARMEKRVHYLSAVLRILLAVLRAFAIDLSHRRGIPSEGKVRLLRAIERSRGAVGLRRILRICGLSPSRLSAWRRAALSCELPDQSSCPHSSPHQVTGEEVSTMNEMVTSSEFRHVPTARLATLAQRLGRVFTSASTWHRLVQERGWRRPRLRIHPEGPKVGIRATKPNQIFHVDTTVIRLLDRTRAYLHAVIDNFSRRILSWRLTDHFDVGNSVAVLVEAGRGLAGLVSLLKMS